MTTHTIAMIDDMQTKDIIPMQHLIKYDFRGVKRDGDVVLAELGFHGEYDCDEGAEHQARRIYEDHDFDTVIITRGDVSWRASP